MSVSESLRMDTWLPPCAGAVDVQSGRAAVALCAALRALGRGQGVHGSQGGDGG